MSFLATLREKGFDQSRYIPFTKQYRVTCSQCEALVINGTPTHERGCPNQVFECFECGQMGAKRARGLCESCANPEQFEDEPLAQEGAPR